MGSPSGPSQQSTEQGKRENKRVSVPRGSYPLCGQCRKVKMKRAELILWSLTFHTATACLQNIGIHFHSGLRQQLVPWQVSVVGGGNEVVIQRLRHVLVYLVVLRVEYVPCRTPHEVGKTWEVGHTCWSLWYDATDVYVMIIFIVR